MHVIWLVSILFNIASQWWLHRAIFHWIESDCKSGCYLCWIRRAILRRIPALNDIGHNYCLIKLLWLIFSPSYWFADLYKHHIADNNSQCCAKPPKAPLGKRARYIKLCNTFYLFLSIFFFMLVAILLYSIPKFFEYIFPIIFCYSISRSIEIVYAFGRDVLENPCKKDTTFDKYGRIKLAIISYIEIYLYSATLYMTTPLACGSILKAIFISLSVGSLTNVGYIVTLDNFGKFGCWQLLPFVQVFTTLSLVVLSLAVYVSREK